MLADRLTQAQHWQTQCDGRDVEVPTETLSVRQKSGLHTIAESIPAPDDIFYTFIHHATADDPHLLRDVSRLP